MEIIITYQQADKGKHNKKPLRFCVELVDVFVEISVTSTR